METNQTARENVDAALEDLRIYSRRVGRWIHARVDEVTEVVTAPFTLAGDISRKVYKAVAPVVDTTYDVVFLFPSELWNDYCEQRLIEKTDQLLEDEKESARYKRVMLN